MNCLYYGDNLDTLRKHIRDETVDLCYIDPPFNSKRTYNQIYNNVGGEDRAQAQAFVDTWTWDDQADEGFQEIIANEKGRYTTQTVALIKGLREVLKPGSLLAYLVSMTRRIVEIHRVLKPTGSFYLHCDPTSSHYLKLVIDGVFCSQGGDFKNEVIWHYRKWSVRQRQFVSNHDVVLFYVKSDNPERVFNQLFMDRAASTLKRFGKAKIVSSHDVSGKRLPSEMSEQESEGVAMDDVWDIGRVPPVKQLFPTQKPDALLERIIAASSDEGQVILDAYCGCGTSVLIAEKMNRRWIGMDITYQSIALIVERLKRAFGKEVADAVKLNGVPKDMASATALANKRDDRTRKEFEKWAVLTYTENRGAVNDKSGADAGIDGTVYFLTSKTENDKMVFQVKSGRVERGDIAKLKGDMHREKAALATFITLKDPTASMRSEAKEAGFYTHELTRRRYDRIQIVTVQDMLERNKRLQLPLIHDVLKVA